MLGFAGTVARIKHRTRIEEPGLRTQHGRQQRNLDKGHGTVDQDTEAGIEDSRSRTMDWTMDRGLGNEDGGARFKDRAKRMDDHELY